MNSLLHWLIFEIRDFIYLLMASTMEWWFQVIPIVLLIITFSVLGEWAEFGKIHKKAFYSLAQGFCSILFYFLQIQIIKLRNIILSERSEDYLFNLYFLFRHYTCSLCVLTFGSTFQRPILSSINILSSVSWQPNMLFRMVI